MLVGFHSVSLSKGSHVVGWTLQSLTLLLLKRGDEVKNGGERFLFPLPLEKPALYMKFLAT